MAADSDVKVPPLSSAASFISFGKKKNSFSLLRSGQLRPLVEMSSIKPAEFKPQEKMLGEERRAWVMATRSWKREA